MTRLVAIVLALAAGGFVRASESARTLLRRPTDVDRELEDENRIVGGTVVSGSTSPYPWFVHGSGCGGSLVAKDVVLTAAHCRGAFRGSVYIGAMRDGSTSNGAEKRNVVSGMTIHPNFSLNTMKFDYMLFQIEPSSKTPIQLNDKGSNPSNNQKLTVIGFGTTSSGGSASSSLRQVTVDAVPQSECNAPNKYNGEIYEPTMLCAGADSGGKDSCQGDSGGPLFDSNKVLVGIVSWGYGCADRKYPGVYSRVSGEIDWIEKQICSLSDYPPSFCGSGPAPAPAPTPSTPSPSQPSGSVQPKYFVEVKYDGYPGEFSAFILDKVTGTRKWNHPRGVGSNSDGNKTFRWQLPQLVPGRRYTLALRDSYGDGICCKRGKGYVKVFADRGGKRTQVDFEWGNFGKAKNTIFTVPKSLQ